MICSYLSYLCNQFCAHTIQYYTLIVQSDVSHSCGHEEDIVLGNTRLVDESIRIYYSAHGHDWRMDGSHD